MKSAAPPPFRVAVLGDSRVFDTYYATDDYAGRTYGYDKTFPHQLQRRLAARTGAVFDCVHIPDHFRGRTVQNNILRLALIDPDCVVLCDGIWESLVSKKHVAEYFEQIGEVAPEYSDRLATELFLANKLSLSPASYSARVARIASWFKRRRRAVIWLTTPVPPADHMGGLHFAGNYRPFDGWHACLRALNASTGVAIGELGGTILDVDLLMADFGGASAALIDQWHFSAGFHSRLAEELERTIREFDGVAADCVSRRTIVQGPAKGVLFGLIGSEHERRAFREQHTGAKIVAECDAGADHVLRTDAAWIILSPERDRDELVKRLSSRAESTTVLLFLEELESLDNPAVADRSAFGSLK